MVEFLNGMCSIADDLVLVQSPVHEEDLLVHILSQLGEEYSQLNAALKTRQHAITYPELFDMLVDHERSLKETETIVAPLMATVNFSQRQLGHYQSRFSSDVNWTNRSSPNPPATRGRQPPNTPPGFSSRQWRSLKKMFGGRKVPHLKKILCLGRTSVIRFGSDRVKY
ncbi:hypothetical protein HanRHA438_Chr13g0617021 [Helianthus annuus]|nr:hypothetical protein HanRHA438_Chr13g0617021 [Helianthus annuus]